MGQLLLPLFPADTEMITPVLGVRRQDGEVYYLLSGMPIYSHSESDLNKFRYITSQMILQGLCKNRDIVRAFHVSTQSVHRYKKILSEQGEAPFFREDLRKGRSHKLLPDVLERIQGKLDKGQSNYSIAKEEGISEGSIRYAIGKGYLKKKG
jgi:predicted transcriptional regulator